MPEMHLRQAVFTYCACGSFNKNRERETGDSRYFYQIELHKGLWR